jgi:FlaA1/EpsC-like NDP-sugar epimerase
MKKSNFKMTRYVKSLSLAASDVILLNVAFISSCYLIDGSTPFTLSRQIILFFAVFVQLLVFLRLGLYRAVLRYASVDFLVTILKTITIASVSLILCFYVAQIHIPPSVIFINWLLSIFLIGGSRFVVRYYYDIKERYRFGKRVLIYGAGDMGVLAVRQLTLNKAMLYTPVGFIDDDKTKHGSVIHGIRVLGVPTDLEDIIERYRVEEVVVAISKLTGEKLQEVVKRCRQKNIVCRIIPCFSRILEMEPNIRSVELADLMRRSPRDLDNEAIKKHLEQKTIMITGAAGSIGSELVRQCLKYNPKRVLALDQSEHGLYLLSEELNNSNVVYELCNVTYKNRLESIFSRYHPEIIFHAAAYKHVPMLEFNSAEAVRNNIGSTKELCELANKYNVKNFVLISTDKAVRPSSIMGATKRVCELVVQNFDTRSKTEFIAVRFGNVLGSSGSVIPKFMEQIKNGGHVTVTHPDATRYFMLIDEAVQLVLQAAAIGSGGEIFILDMGKPVRIVDMAEDLIYLMGRQPHEDIKIEYTGLRPGEKIHEELFSDEIERKTRFSEITIGRPKVVDWEWLEKNVDELLARVSNGGSESALDIIDIMKTLVPEGDFGAKQIPVTETDKQGAELYATQLQ